MLRFTALRFNLHTWTQAMVLATTNGEIEMLIPKCLLKGALLMAGVKDSRYVLNGVHVEQGNGGTWIVGTDGAMLFAAFHSTSEVLDVPSVIIPRDALTAALKLDKRPDLDVSSATLGALAYVPIDAVFPPWRRVLPGATLSGEWPASFDSVLLDRAVKAVCLANSAPHHGLNVAIFPDRDSLVVRGKRARCLVKVMAGRNELRHDDKTPVVYEPLGA